MTRLPDHSHLSPVLKPLMDMPIQLVEELGPRVAAARCDETATGLLFTLHTDGEVRLTADDRLVTPDHVLAGGLWLAACARALERQVN